MQALQKTLKISSKGQITLPKMVRELLGTDYVRVVVADGHIHLQPAMDPAGSLRDFSTDTVAIDDARDKAWEEVVREKHDGG